MPIHKIIFRLDLKQINFAIVDKQGEMMKMLYGQKESNLQSQKRFFSNISEHRDARATTCFHNDENIFYSFSVTPNLISCEIESAIGFDLNKLEDENSFQKLSKITNEICDFFQIHELSRLGIRLFYFDKLFCDEKVAVEKYRKICNTSFANQIDESLGNISDLALCLDGKHQDDVYYKFRAGPLLKEQVKNYVTNFRMSEVYTNMYDIDLFEFNLNINNIRFSKRFVNMAWKLGNAAQKLENVFNDIKL